MKKKQKSISYAKWGYIFILPFFLCYFIFSLIPLADTIRYQRNRTNLYRYGELWKSAGVRYVKVWCKYFDFMGNRIYSADSDCAAFGGMVYGYQIKNTWKTNF